MGAALRALWSDSPAVTRFLCAAYPLLSLAGVPLLARLVPAVRVALLCCLHTVLHRRYVWALFGSLLYRPIQHVLSVVMVLVEVYLSLAYLPEREKDLGSSRFLAWTLLTTGVVNVLFLSVMFLLSRTVGSQYWMTYNQGLWPLLMVCITLRSLASPREPIGVFGVAYVPSRWYPAVLAAVLSLLSGGVLWDVAAALAVGYAHSALRLEQLLPSPACAAALEQSCLGRRGLSLLRRLGGTWVPARGARGYEDLEGVGRRYATLSDLRSARAQQVGAADGGSSELPLFRGGATGGPRGAVPGAPEGTHRVPVFTGPGQRLGR